MGSSFLGETALPVSRPRRPVEFPGKRRLENQMGLLVETFELKVNLSRIPGSPRGLFPKRGLFSCLFDLSLSWQVWILDPGASFGLAHTAGLEVTIG